MDKKIYSQLIDYCKHDKASRLRQLLESDAASEASESSTSAPPHSKTSTSKNKKAMTGEVAPASRARRRRRRRLSPLELCFRTHRRRPTPLHVAAAHGAASSIEVILDYALANSSRLHRFLLIKDERGDTVLHVAARNGHDAALTSLLSARFVDDERLQAGDLCSHNRRHETPIMCAVRAMSLRCVQALTKASNRTSPRSALAINDADHDGETPVRVARRARNFQICHALITNGADVTPMYDFKLDGLLEESKELTTTTSLAAAASASVFKFHDESVANSYDNKPSRVRKWMQMIDAYDASGGRRWPLKFSERLDKGVPHCMRGQVWSRVLLSDTGQTAAALVGEFRRGCAASSVGASGEQIDLDVHRETRTHQYFLERYGRHQCALFHALKTLALMDTELSYCQAMSSISALLLIAIDGVDEDDGARAYAALRALFAPDNRRHLLRSAFLPGFPLMTQVTHVHAACMQRYHASIHQTLEEAGFTAEVYAFEWYLKLFFHRLPFALVARVWDRFVVRGYAPLAFAVAMAIFDEFIANNNNNNNTTTSVVGGGGGGANVTADVIIGRLQHLEEQVECRTRAQVDRFMSTVSRYERRLADDVLPLLRARWNSQHISPKFAF